MSIVQQNFQFSTPFLLGYKKLVIPIVDSDGNPAWPSVFPIDKIELLRQTVGLRHFSAQMMLEYINENKSRLDPGALHFYESEFDLRTAKLGDNLITGASLYWDPSMGKTKSDNSVCVIIYRDDKNKFAFIYDVKYLSVNDSDNYPLETQCMAVLNFMNLHNQKVIGIEINGLGNSLPEIITKIANNNGQEIFVRKIKNSQRKETRILDSIEPLLSTGRLYAHERLRATPLLAEMLGWSPLGGAGHDDGIDALAGALQMQSVPVRPRGNIFHPIHAKTEFKI